MKHMKKFKKSNLLSQKEREKILVEAAERANLIMTICVLHDCFGFGKKRINRFVDKYVELANSFQMKNEDLTQINQELWERFDIKII